MSLKRISQGLLILFLILAITEIHYMFLVLESAKYFLFSSDYKTFKNLLFIAMFRFFWITLIISFSNFLRILIKKLGNKEADISKAAIFPLFIAFINLIMALWNLFKQPIFSINFELVYSLFTITFYISFILIFFVIYNKNVNIFRKVIFYSILTAIGWIIVNAILLLYRFGFSLVLLTSILTSIMFFVFLYKLFRTPIKDIFIQTENEKEELNEKNE